MDFAELIRGIAQTIGSTATVKCVYGEPVTAGQCVAIPVARVRCAFGGGGGTDGSDDAARRHGGGGGAHIRAEPCGVVEVSPEGVRFIYFLPPQTIAIAAAAGFLLGVAVAWRSCRRGD